MSGARGGGATIAGAGLLCLALGSVHAFSVFLAPLERAHGVSRGQASLTYSLALVSLTLVVLAGPRLYGLASPGRLLAMAGLAAAAGALIAALAPGLALVWLGYGLVFGAANGLGYGFGLQLAARANPGQEGMAMGAVTACYALGAALAPLPLVAALEAGGLFMAMAGLSLSLALAGLGAAALIARGGVVFAAGARGEAAVQVSRTFLPTLWIAYGAAVFAGLMVIGHAVEIARGAGLATAAPSIIAVFNMLGSLMAGFLSDRAGAGLLLRLLPLLGAAALGAMAMAGGASAVMFAGLAVVGGAYGATIAVYPALIAKDFGPTQGPRAYGRVFTAWGLAGLMAPVLAGALFDRGGDYRAALLMAAALGLVSALAFDRWARRCQRPS